MLGLIYGFKGGKSINKKIKEVKKFEDLSGIHNVNTGFEPRSTTPLAQETVL